MYPCDWAYFAGYIDADGCICVSRKNSKGAYSVTLNISSINIDTLNWFKENTNSRRYIAETDKKRKQEIRDEMKSLNHRGVDL